MAVRKAVVKVMLMVAIMPMMAPSTSAIRGFDMGRHALMSVSGVLSKAQMELGDLSLEDQQQQAMHVDMDAAKRNLLSYDPYYNNVCGKWWRQAKAGVTCHFGLSAVAKLQGHHHFLQSALSPQSDAAWSGS